MHADQERSMSELSREGKVYFIMHIMRVPMEDREKKARKYNALTDEQLHNRYMAKLELWWDVKQWRALWP